MTFGIIIGFTLFGFALMSLMLHLKKRSFNSIVVGDEIFYMSISLCDNISEVEDVDFVTQIEFYDNGEIKCIHTEKGKTFTFLDFIRDEFVLRND